MAACWKSAYLQRPDLPQRKYADICSNDAVDNPLRAIQALPAVLGMQIHGPQPLRQAGPLIGSHRWPSVPSVDQLLPVPHVCPGCQGEDAC